MPAVSEIAAQPLYERTYDALVEHISKTTWRPGSRLPSERALCSSLGVSRLTLRRALFALAQDGLVERSAGRGWLVSTAPVSEPPNELLSFSAMARSRGLRPSADVLRADVRDANLVESEALQVAPGAAVFELERLHRLDGVPIALGRALLPAGRAPWLTEIDFTEASLHDSLESHGISPTRAEYVIEVIDADERTAALLDVPVGLGLLLASGDTFDPDGVPIERGWMAYRPDRYRLRTTLIRRNAGQPPPHVRDDGNP